MNELQHPNHITQTTTLLSTSVRRQQEELQTQKTQQHEESTRLTATFGEIETHAISTDRILHDHKSHILKLQEIAKKQQQKNRALNEIIQQQQEAIEEIQQQLANQNDDDTTTSSNDSRRRKKPKPRSPNISTTHDTILMEQDDNIHDQQLIIRHDTTQVLSLNDDDISVDSNQLSAINNSIDNIIHTESDDTVLNTVTNQNNTIDSDSLGSMMDPGSHT
jgi:chromosome segregation ATPase